MTAELATTNWLEANQRYLSAELDRIRAALEGAIEQPVTPPAPLPVNVSDHLETPPAIEHVVRAFRLSPFERDILLLCAGIELDSSVGSLCAEARADPACPWPTFSLALRALTEPHWSALSPQGPLRRWQLIEVTPGNTLVGSPLKIDERVLHYLAGVGHLDERLAGMLMPLPAPQELPPSQAGVAQRIAAAWSDEVSGTFPVVVLSGADRRSTRAIARAACASLNMSVSALSSSLVPASAPELDALVRLLEREAVLGSIALLLEEDDGDPSDTWRPLPMAQLIDRLGSPLIVASRDPLRSITREVLTLHVPTPGAAEQRELWQRALAAVPVQLDGLVDRLVSQFNLAPAAIEAACMEAGHRPHDTMETLEDRLWSASRHQVRPGMQNLAERIDAGAGWDDLVLPGPQKQLLGEITAQVRQRARVYEDWGFASRGRRGLGISALFAGPSGTGKTMAAEVLANELRLDLYRIDLSQVVSKYIGETEKNLRRIFDEAEDGGAILFFDEADALFGKRSEVKDSHDRYANIEVSYLLQRMEAYRGLAILTTNMKSALDTAFLRRIRFVVQFPFPDATQRAGIWRRVFPTQTPTDGLDIERLARLTATGGNIRNIALNAAFLAADAGVPVAMGHVLRATHVEYAKLEKPLNDAETRGWT